MQWTEEAIKEALDGHFWTVSYEGRQAVIDVLQGRGEPEHGPRNHWDDSELRQLMLLKRKGHTIDEIEAIMDRNRRCIARHWSNRREWAPRVATPSAEPLTLDSIRRAVCAVYSVGKHAFCSRSRDRKVCDARQVFYWISRRYTGRTTTQIADAAGGRDHSTIVHGADRVEQLFDRYKANIELILYDLGLEMPKQERAAA